MDEMDNIGEAIDFLEFHQLKNGEDSIRFDAYVQIEMFGTSIIEPSRVYVSLSHPACKITVQDIDFKYPGTFFPQYSKYTFVDSSFLLIEGKNKDGVPYKVSLYNKK